MVAVLVLCCALAAAAAACSVQLVGQLHGRPARPRRPTRLVDRLLALAESAGHGRVFLAAMRLPGVSRLAQGLRELAASRGRALTAPGALAAHALATCAACLACAVLAASALGVVVGLAASASLTAAASGSMRRRRRDALAAQMPDALRCLSGALGAGKSLSQAIEHVGLALPEPMGPQFLQASFQIKAGLSVEEAVAGLCRRVDAPGIALLGTALQISQRTGSALNDLFDQTAQMATDAVALRRELEVKTSQVRLSAKVVAVMPVALCALLTLLSSDYRAGLALPAGRACLLVSVMLDLAALVLVRRIMSGGLR